MQMIIMQGVPGSGKSTRARALGELTGATVLSTDSYFETPSGYKFDRDKLGYYHQLNQMAAETALAMGLSVIIDNTNLKREHVEPYLALARRFHVPVEVVRCTGAFENTHGVPLERVNKMLEDMEDLGLDVLQL